jgi:putative acetyltransferase
MEVRSYREGDAEALAEVFHRSVREGAARRYSAAAVAAWSPELRPAEVWEKRLEGTDTIVATEDGVLIGFMNIDAKGYLDLAFVLPEVMGKGVADAIYAVLEGRARATGLDTLTVQASLLAEPFFARQGWSLVRRQEIEIGGEVLRNARMEKRLRAEAA